MIGFLLGVDSYLNPPIKHYCFPRRNLGEFYGSDSVALEKWTKRTLFPWPKSRSYAAGVRSSNKRSVPCFKINFIGVECRASHIWCTAINTNRVGVWCWSPCSSFSMTLGVEYRALPTSSQRFVLITMIYVRWWWLVLMPRENIVCIMATDVVREISA